MSSRDERESFYIDPFPLSKDSIAKLVKIIQSMERVRILKQTERYLHAEFTSKFFRFKDDVEFWVDEEAGLIHIRSASRVGYSDLGVNRKRMETIRRMWIN